MQHGKTTTVPKASTSLNGSNYPCIKWMQSAPLIHSTWQILLDLHPTVYEYIEGGISLCPRPAWSTKSTNLIIIINWETIEWAKAQAKAHVPKQTRSALLLFYPPPFHLPSANPYITTYEFHTAQSTHFSGQSVRGLASTPHHEPLLYIYILQLLLYR